MKDREALLQRIHELEAELAQLREREQDLTDSVENASMGLHWAAADGTIQWVNQAELDLLGYAKDEYVGRHIATFHADSNVIEDILRRLGAGETLLNYEARLRAKDGSLKHVLISSNVRWEGDKFLHTRCFTRDITARKEAEEALRASEERFTRFMENLSGAAWMKDLEGCYIYANNRAERLFCRPRGEFLGRTDEELFSSEVAAKFKRQDQLAFEAGISVATEILPQGDRLCHYEIHTFTIAGQGAKPTLLGGLAMDVTERMRHEAALSLMSSIIEHSQDAILSKDLTGTILSWNPAAERLYGYAAGEIVGRSTALLMPANRQSEEEEILAKLRRGERIEHLETVRKRKDGTDVWVSLTISPIRRADGAVIAASHIARDITERKRLDETLQQSAKLESLGVLAGGVAHDFNNLLTGILGNTSLALENLPRFTPARRFLEDAAQASEKAAHLTKQLLAYAGKGRFVITRIDLSKLVQEISALVRTSIPKHVQLRLDLEESLPCVECDSTQIQQVVMNLVINGAEAIGDEKEGTVFVTTRFQSVDKSYLIQTFGDPPIDPGQYVALEVHDTGCGMDEATLGKIFDPFFTTKFTGRGLGLAAVLGIVRGHRGALKVYSAPGKGTTFKVLLPASTAVACEEVEELRKPNLIGSGTVLVIDDEETIRRTAKSALEHYGYSVVLAEDGRQGVDLFRQMHESIVAVLLDLTMPVLGGEETLRYLKLINRDVPIILSSGYNEVETIQHFTGKGLAGFLQKPYTGAALGQTVKALLHPKENGQ